MSFSMQLQLSYLWLHRDREIEPARTLLSPLATEGELWFSVGGCVGFMTEEQNATDFSSVVLLSAHSVLAKDHRKLLLRHQLQGGADESDYLGLVLRTIGGSEITFLPSSVDQWKRWIAQLRMSGVKVSDSLEEELKGIKRASSCKSASVDTRYSSSPKDTLRKFQNMEKEAITVERSSYLSPPQFMKKSISISHLSPATQTSTPKRRTTPHQIRIRWKEVARKALNTPEAMRVRGRMQAIRNLVKTECAYVRALYTMVHQYREPLLVAVATGVINIPTDLINSMFLNCEALLSLHQTFLTALTQACSSPNPLLNGIFQVTLPQLHSYADFITLKRRHARRLTPLQECLQNQSFSDFLSEWHRSHDGEGKQLKRLLLRPQERLYEYAKALEHITSSTDKCHCDYGPLKASHDQLRTLIARLNTDQSPRELHDKICHIIRGVGSSAASLLTGPSTIIKEEVTSTVKVPVSSLKSMKYRTIVLYLFDTALVVWVKESKHSHSFFPLYGATVYEHVSLEGKVYSNPTADCSRRSFKLYSPGGPRQGVVLSFKHYTERATWLTVMKKAIADAQPKCAPTPKETSHGPKSRLRRSLSTYSLNSVFVQSARHSTPVTTPVMGRKLERNPSIMSVSSVSSIASVTSTSTSNLLHKSYTVAELFNFLVDPPSTDYVKTFLLTYHLFTNATEVMDALIEAHQHWLSSPQGTEGHTPAAQRLRCLNAFKIWVNKFYTDFRHDGSLKQMLSRYLTEALRDPSTFEGEKEQMKRIIDVIHKSETVLTMQRNKLRAPMFFDDTTPCLKFVEISADRIANQMTVIEHEVLQRIKPFELVGQKWTKRNKRDIAPGICSFIERFNLTTRWVVREVLTPQLPRQRAIMIEKFIRVSETCMGRNNFNTVFEITLALQSAPVRRLHQTWQEVSYEAMQLLSNFKLLVNPRNSFSALKEQIRKCSTPAVPYIGAFLSQLVTLEEGMSTFLEDQPDHINFTKLHKMAGLIEEITRLQMPPYAIEADQNVIRYLSDTFDTLSEFGEDEQDLLSAEREPRAGSASGTPVVNHRILSVVSSGSHSSESLSQRSSEDFSLLGSCEEMSTNGSSEAVVDREQRDRQDSGVVSDTAV